MKIYLIYINRHYIMRATYGKEMHAEFSWKEQPDNVGSETMTAWVGLIWLRISIPKRLFWNC
jgi:hypothetical protein